MFDKEQYNFIINRRTFLTCDNMVGQNFEKLNYILNKLEEIDPILLDQLNYYYEKEIAEDEDEEELDQDDDDADAEAIVENSLAKNLHFDVVMK